MGSDGLEPPTPCLYGRAPATGARPLSWLTHVGWRLAQRLIRGPLFGLFVESVREFRPRPDAQLRVDLRQVPLDRARRDEELGGDLLVRAALGDERSDAPLGRGQLVGARPAAADPGEA